MRASLFVHLYRLKPALPRLFFSYLERWAWASYWKTRSLPEKILGGERDSLIRRILESRPSGSILEVGCGKGVNLQELSQILPNIRLIGVDKNEATLKDSRVKNEGGFSLIEGDLTKGLPFGNAEFDITFTLASLLYIPGDSLEFSAKELLRVTRRRIILVEQHLSQHSTFVHNLSDLSGYWIHDYVSLFSKFPEVAKVSVERIEHPLFESEQWQTLGQLIIIDKRE